MLPFIPAFVPNILQALAVVCLFFLPLSRQVRNHPAVFYALFAACSAATFFEPLPGGALADTLVQLVASCYTGVAIYLAVMFAGALPKRWKATKRLLSIRSEMSIIGGIVIFAHCLRVLSLAPLSFSWYWGLIWGEGALPMLLACGVVGPALLVCFMVPWVTSFPFVRRRMSYPAWKRTQKLAYPFMALLVLQGAFLAVGHGMYVGPEGPGFAVYATTAVTYLAIGVAYLALKALGVGRVECRGGGRGQRAAAGK